MPRLSLCLIARDEQEMLPGCLASVAGLVDEMIVVDTGSVDGTRAIAVEAGARVFDLVWGDDFAAARNAAVEVATGDWVLCLDADERLAPGVFEAVRRALTADIDCGCLPIFDADALGATVEAVLDGRARSTEPVLLPRLFRRTPDLRWHGRVHEHVNPWLEGREDRCAAVAAPIVHYGNVASVRVERRKHERNFRLLERQRDEEPEHLWTYAYLASEHRWTGAPERAAESAQQGWVRLRAQLAAGRRPSPSAVVALATHRIELGLASGDVASALDALGVATGLGLEHPNLTYYRALIDEYSAPPVGAAREQRLQQAGMGYLEVLGAERRLYTVPVGVGITSWKSRVRLGTVLLNLGEHAQALAQLDRALASQPGDAEAQLGRAEALLGLGRVAEASRALSDDDSADAGVLRACIKLARGSDELEPDLHASAFLAPHRRALADLLRARSGDAFDMVFIGGAGRSGTTLLGAMLGAHPKLYAPPELVALAELLELRVGWAERLDGALPEMGIDPERLDCAVRAFAEAYLMGIAPEGRRLCENTPHNVLYFDRLARLFPRARFVHVVRDGRAVVASLLRQSWSDPRTGAPVEYCQSPRAAAAYWASAIRSARRSAPWSLGRLVEVRYEALVAAPEATMRSVFAAICVPWDDGVLRHHASPDLMLRHDEVSTPDVRRPLYTDALDRWRDELDPAALAAVQHEAGDLLQELGYA